MTIEQVNRKLNDMALEIAQLRSEVQRFSNPDQPRNAAVMQVVTAVARQYDIAPELAFSRTQKQPIVNVRQESTYLIFNWLSYSYTKAGLVFGQDHGTAINAVKKTQDRLSVDKVLRQRIIGACKEIGIPPKEINKMFNAKC